MALRLITSAWRNFYAIDGDGLLRWYRYLGSGEANDAPGSVNWHPNSGNPIGHGWLGTRLRHRDRKRLGRFQTRRPVGRDLGHR
jgi:hypothetical protein